MGSAVDRRLGALEQRIIIPEGELRARAYREFLRRLADEESDWLGEPIEEAEALVECPIHGPRCDCRNEQRRLRAHEEQPLLMAEFRHRNESLLERAEEIMAREPAVRDWRRGYGVTA
jgi:hypothetical protein